MCLAKNQSLNDERKGKKEKKEKKIKSKILEIAAAAEWRAFLSFLPSEFKGAKEG